MHDSHEIRTVLICRNSLVRAGIRHILNGTRFTVAREVEDSSNPPAFPDVPPALAIIDESHFAQAVAESVADLKAECPTTQVVVVADHLDPKTIMRSLQAGMNGLLSTTMERDALIKALELVMLGETFIPGALALTMLNEVSHPHVGSSNTTPALTTPGDTAMRAHNLSKREVEILGRLMEGESNKVIARKLDIAEATIKVHVKTILRKLQATNRTQAAIWAAAHLSTASNSGAVTQDWP